MSNESNDTLILSRFSVATIKWTIHNSSPTNASLIDSSRNVHSAVPLTVGEYRPLVVGRRNKRGHWCHCLAFEVCGGATFD
jgi:hypothetical protein